MPTSTFAAGTEHSRSLSIYSRVEKLPGQPRGIAVSDSNIVFIACGPSICMYRQQQGVLVTHPLPFEATSIAVSPRGAQIAVGGKVRRYHQSLVSGRTSIHLG